MAEEEKVETPQAENQVEPETTTTESPTVETETAESTETEGAPEQGAAEETKEDPERKPNRAERRIRQLSDQAKQLQQQNQQLQGQASPQFPQYQPGEEIAPERLQRDVVQTAQAIADLTVQNRIAQERAVTNVERDTELLPTQYDELNPKSSDYSEELEKAITEEFQEKAFRVVGYYPNGQPQLALDPSVRLSDIAKRYTETARAVAGKSKANMKNAVAQSADTNAIKPQGESKGEKPFAEKSIKEMEAELGFAKR